MPLLVGAGCPGTAVSAAASSWVAVTAGVGVSVGGTGVAVWTGACWVKRASTVSAAAVDIAAASGVGCDPPQALRSRARAAVIEIKTKIFWRIIFLSVFAVF